MAMQFAFAITGERAMHAEELTNRVAGLSPRSLARLAGVCQLLESLLATFGPVIVLNKLVVSGNAAATAANIVAHEKLYWAGFATSLLGVAFHIAWGFLLYELLRPVRRRLSFFALLVILVACAIQALWGLFYIAPVLVLTGGSSLSGFSTQQLQALAILFLKLHSYAFNINLVFFGLWCFLTGYMIFKSTFLPRVLGALLMISGIAWMFFLSPPIAYSLFTYIAVASAIGEIPLELWCIVKGVDNERWRAQAAAVGMTSS